MPATRSADHPLEERLAEDGDAEALVDGDRRLTRAEWSERATRLADGLERRFGVVAGDRVALRLSTRIEFFELTFALAKLRAHPLLVPRELPQGEAERIMTLAEPRATVEDEDEDDRRVVVMPRGAREETVGIEDLIASGARTSRPIPGPPPGPAFLVTSGTTGRPKAVLRELDSTQADARRTMYGDLFDAIGLGAGDRHLLAGTVEHTMPTFYARHALERGGTVVVLRRFDPREALALIARERVSTAFLAPDMLSRVAEAEGVDRADLSSLRAVMSGGTALPPALADRIEDLLSDGSIHDLYGTVETGLVTVAGPAERHWAPGSVGRALAEVEVRILGDDREVLGPGKRGRIALRCPTMVHGYHDDPEATAEHFVDGFFAPGDVGHLDGDGHLYVDDRAADVIDAGSGPVYPSHVEAVLRCDEAVHDVAVVAIGVRGVLAAVVEPRPGARTPRSDRLIERCRAELPAQAVPGRVDVVDELPRTALGKVVRREVRERLGR